MKIFFTAILLSLCATCVYPQEAFTLNLGGTSQQNYYTEIDYENIRWTPIIKVTISGKTYRFALDTGAPVTITKTLFDDLKPKIINKVPIWDTNGKVDSLNIVSLSDIAIGDVVFNDIPAVVPKDQFFFDCMKVDGFIGSNMLRNSVVHFSSRDHKIVLTDQPDKLNLNREHSSDLFLTQVQSNPVVSIKVAGKGSGTIPALFDTGSAGFFDLALTHFGYAEQAEIFDVLAKSRGRRNIGLYGAGSDTTQYRLRVPELSINGGLFKNVNVSTTTGDDSTIGARFLDFGMVTIDYNNKKFYFEPFEPIVDSHERLFPINCIPRDNKIFIEMIWDEQLKEKMSVNDQVLAINDVDYTNISMCDYLLKTDLYDGKNQVVLTLKTPEGIIKKVAISKK